MLSITGNSINAKTNGCVEWYWVTTYASGKQTWDYMYTTCSCEENTYRVSTCGGSGGGGNGNTPSFPQVPTENQIIDFFSPEGEFIRYQFINNTWKIVLINLADVIVKTIPAKYSFLIFNYPVNQQKVYNDGMVYTFESEINTWSGVIATDELIAQTIEDQIDDSKLDPCTKAILNKLKNSTQSDIAAMLTHFAPVGSIFNINMAIGQVKDNNPNFWAQTQKVTGSSTDINMVLNQDYINGTGNINRPTDLSIATTMAHEVIHAYLISLLEQNLASGSSAIYDFATVYEAYVQQQITNDKSILPDAHHELIASNYVYSIASSIQEFHTGQPVGSGFPRQVYLDMALGGLTGTTFFNKNYPNDPNDKNYNDRIRIFARINTEKLGSQYGVNTPLGTPCKK